MAQDPTAQKALGKNDLTPQQKVDGLMSIVHDVGSTAMLTTRSPDGKLASRPMSLAAVEGLVFSHFMNTDSGKTDDVEADPNVNISFYNAKTTDWVSVSGTAKVVKDKSKIRRHWTSKLQAWFDDKKDGVHNGTHDDPRVALLDITPTEIRWFKAASALKQAAEVVKAQFTSEAAATGRLVIISEDEIKILSKVHST